MSIFSLDWFKSEREKELEQLKIEEQRLKNLLLQKMIDTPDLFKNYKHDESQNIKAISTSGNISIMMPDKREYKVEPKEEPKDVVPEKSSTIDQELPRTMPQDVWVKDITAAEEHMEKVSQPPIDIKEILEPVQIFTESKDGLRKELVQESFTPVAVVELITVTESTPKEEPKASLREIIEMVDNLKDVIEKKEAKVVVPPTPPVPATVYKTAKLINNVINVILRDGTILTKVGVDREFFERVKAAQTEDEIRNIFVPKEQEARKKVDDEKKEEVKKEIEETKAILKGIDLLAALPDFTVDGSSVYLRETKRSIPELLVKEFSKVVGSFEGTPLEIQEKLKASNEYNALKNFFLWCCLNPRPEVADQLYGFLKRNSFRITKQGFFVALRNVVTIKGEGATAAMDRDLLDFVTNGYNKIKAVWKMKPDNFRVLQLPDKSYVLDNMKKERKDKDYKVIGNIVDLYKKELPKMPGNRFTDAHTKTFDIRVGKVVNMPANECSWSTADCNEKGLHFTADQIHYVGCGDTSVLVLINPMKVVGIGQQKGRCYEYLPIMTVPSNEATKLLHDVAFDTLELDEDYAIRELETLTKKAEKGFTSESSKYQFSVPSVPVDEIGNIFKSLKEMEATLSKRISIIK